MVYVLTETVRLGRKPTDFKSCPSFRFRIRFQSHVQRYLATTNRFMFCEGGEKKQCEDWKGYVNQHSGAASRNRDRNINLYCSCLLIRTVLPATETEHEVVK